MLFGGAGARHGIARPRLRADRSVGVVRRHDSASRVWCGQRIAKATGQPNLPAYTAKMRLSTYAGSTIRQTVHSVLGPDAKVCLFGSRTDDSAKGGDIDLLVESDTAVEQPVLVAARIGALLQRALGDQRIDVLIAAPNVPEQTIHRVARASGIAL